jgi:hypothetical protein
MQVKRGVDKWLRTLGSQAAAEKGQRALAGPDKNVASSSVQNLKSSTTEEGPNPQSRIGRRGWAPTVGNTTISARMRLCGWMYRAALGARFTLLPTGAEALGLSGPRRCPQVRKNGGVSQRGRTYFVSRVFIGENVQLRFLENTVLVWLCRTLIRQFDLKEEIGGFARANLNRNTKNTSAPTHRACKGSPDT